jgi:DNA-binding NarL/FixJ family response regulator
MESWPRRHTGALADTPNLPIARMEGDAMPIRVFLADDHAIIRDGLRAILSAQEDMTVVGEAGDGRQAVREVQRLKPDVVVMDIAMPELNGTDATREIQRTCPGVRVIILSMYATSEHIYQSLRAGARGYLLKESAGAEVVTAVRVVHAGHRYLSQKIADSVVQDYLDKGSQEEKRSPVEALSPRERDILLRVVEGKSSAEIAEALLLSPKTVETYRSRLMQKLGVENLPELVKFAILHGIAPLR